MEIRTRAAVEAFYSMRRIRTELVSSPAAQRSLYRYVAFGEWS